MTSLNRRTFLTLTGGAAAAGLIGGLVLPRPAHARAAQASSPRRLVVVDLQGGNDALNTLVPQSGRYHDLRPSLALADDALLTFDGLPFGVHPSLASLETFWNRGQMSALYGTGLQGQGRSHFVAQDAWRSAQPGVPARSGWIGRWLEATPDEAASRLRAISLGQSTLAAQGEQGRPVAIQSVDGFQLNPPGGNADVTAAMLAMAAGADDSLFGQAQSALPQTVQAVNTLQELIAAVDSSDTDDEADDSDAALFSAAQAIIQGDVGAQVIYITINGFDTHALQGPKQDLLLRLVADGLSTMFAGLEETGHAEGTLAMVVSEFGRRVAENGSFGTDHGRGGLSFLLGPAVQSSQVIGEPDLANLVDGDLAITLDARVMYDNALRWLGASDSHVVEVLGAEWNDVQLLTA